MLLDMGCDFLDMSLFQGIDSFIVRLELGELLFVFLYASVKAALELLHLALKVTNGRLVRSL